MDETIIWYIIVLGCAGLFYGIGVFAQQKDTPMHFWSGTTVDVDYITDVPAYNRENGIMWKCYSLWYWAAGFAMAWNAMTAVILLIAGGTAGIVLLILTYRQIEKKYTI